MYQQINKHASEYPLQFHRTKCWYICPHALTQFLPNRNVGTFVHMHSHILFLTDMYFPRKPYVASTLNLLYHIIIFIVFFLENLTYLLSHTIIYISTR